MTERNASGGIEYLHSYADHSFNTCGQATIATVLDYHGLDPYGLERPVYDERDGRHHWRDEQIIDRIKKRFPPDYFFGLFGTTGEQLGRALADAGLKVRVRHSADPGVGREIWEDAKRHVSTGSPVVVVMDRGKLGGQPFAAHWGILHKVDGSRIHLANSKGTPVIEEADFLRAFRCRFMPAKFNHCAIFSRRV